MLLWAINKRISYESVLDLDTWHFIDPKKVVDVPTFV